MFALQKRLNKLVNGNCNGGDALAKKKGTNANKLSSMMEQCFKMETEEEGSNQAIIFRDDGSFYANTDEIKQIL